MLNSTWAGTSYGLGLHIYRVIGSDPHVPQHLITIFKVTLDGQIHQVLCGANTRPGHLGISSVEWLMLSGHQTFSPLLLPATLPSQPAMV